MIEIYLPLRTIKDEQHVACTVSEETCRTILLKNDVAAPQLHLLALVMHLSLVELLVICLYGESFYHNLFGATLVQFSSKLGK